MVYTAEIGLRDKLSEEASGLARLSFKRRGEDGLRSNSDGVDGVDAIFAMASS